MGQLQKSVTNFKSRNKAKYNEIVQRALAGTPTSSAQIDGIAISSRKRQRRAIISDDEDDSEDDDEEGDVAEAEQQREEEEEEEIDIDELRGKIAKKRIERSFFGNYYFFVFGSMG